MRIFDSNWQGKDGIKFFIQGWEPQLAKPKAVIALIHGVGEHIGRYQFLD